MARRGTNFFYHVRYHEADVFNFEQRSAQHWLTILGDRVRVPRIVTHPPKDAAALTPTQQDAQADPAAHYVSIKEIVATTGLPIHQLKDRTDRERKRIPHLLLVGNLRFSMEAILQWELANSVTGIAPEPNPTIAAIETSPEPVTSERIPRWHEVVMEQTGGYFDSTQGPK